MTGAVYILAAASVFFPGRRNVFTSDSPVSFEVDTPAVYRVVNDIGSEERRAVAADASADHPGRFIADAGRLPPGFYHVWTEGTECARFAVVPPDIQRTASNSVAQLDFGRNGAWSRRKNERCAELAALAGVTWVRERFGWGWPSYEPQRGKFFADPIIAFMEPEKRHGLKILFSHMGLPKWAAAKDESGYGADLRDTYRSSAEIARRLSGHVQCWEYWNEPDSWPFGRGPAENLSAGQKALFLGVRSTGLGIPVAMAAPSSIASRDFIDDCFENGIADAFDIYNTHVYLMPEGYPGALLAHEALLAAHGAAQKERMIGEAGSEAAKIDAVAHPPRWMKESDVPDGEEPDTVGWDFLPVKERSEVSATFVKCWTHAAAHGWSRYFSFCFSYYNESGGARVWGMLGPGMIATSTYAALAAYNTHVGPKRYKGELSGLPSGVTGWLFSDGASHTAVCWASRETPFPFPGAKSVFALTGDKFAEKPKTMGEAPVFVSFAEPPPVIGDAEPADEPPIRHRPDRLSPIVLDFVRDTSSGRFRVNTHRRHILTASGETIRGKLNIYNFGAEQFDGAVTGVWPEGWSGPKGFAVSVPPMGRVTRDVSFKAPTSFFREVARVGFDADSGRSRTRATFLCAGELDAEPVFELTGLEAKGYLANRLVCTNGVLDYAFQGKELCAYVSASVPPQSVEPDGVMFRLTRVARPDGRPEASFHYIDVVVSSHGGRQSWLKPNIFPVFVDNVSETCFTVRFDELTPPLSGADVERVEIRFNRFEAGRGRTAISDFRLWRSRSGASR